MKTLIHQDPFIAPSRQRSWQNQGHWPAAWIKHSEPDESPFVVAYRRAFHLDADAPVRVHVSADERYILFVDGEIVGRGPERGDPDHWFYETYDLALAAGDHVMVAQVWALGGVGPEAQMSVQPGFILAAEVPYGGLLSTGVAAWDGKRLQGYHFVPQMAAWLGYTHQIDGMAFDWGFETGQGSDWEPALPTAPGVGKPTGWAMPRQQHWLRPAFLPDMLTAPITGSARHVSDLAVLYWENVAVHGTGDTAPWTALLHGGPPVTVPPNTIRRVIFDLENYYCAYPELDVSGGAGGEITLSWAEALYLDPNPNPFEAHKGQRDQIEGGYFWGLGNELTLEGGKDRRYRLLWWRCGRYVQVVIRTGAEPVTIERLALLETRYPLEMQAQVTLSDPRLNAIVPLCVRSIQVSAHEAYFDSPYYEQMMYVSDARIEALTTYMMSRDDRLPRKAIQLFDWSREHLGLVQARYPCQVRQYIPAWSLYWIGMVYDYALWRDDPAFVRAMMPGVRTTLEGIQRFANADGLLEAVIGWNNFDWVDEWEAGIPPDADWGVSGLLNWQMVYSLRLAAELETLLDEPSLAAYDEARAAQLARRLEAFWDAARGLYADDRAHRHFSEHTQVFALLSGQLDAQRQAQVLDNLFTDPDLSRMTYHATHYLFEVCQRFGRMDGFFSRMREWFDLVEQGFVTTPERQNPTRSDCHGWSAHPLVHYFATILGIRPASLGFNTVTITPQLGSLTAAQGRLPHPRGEIVVEVRVENGVVQGSITLPDGVTGNWRANGQTIDLRPGQQEIR
jgi:hypothetical protein